MQLKFLPASVVADSALNDRQIRVVANSGQLDRAGDILVAKGCSLKNYASNPIVLAQHDPASPIGNFSPEINDQVQGVITFAPAGISAKADEYCGLYKAGILKAVSVGFTTIKATPNKNGGVTYEEWELMELSCVSVPCDPGAIVIGRAAAAQTKAEDSVVWKVGASRNLPIGGDDAWDGAAAEAGIFEKAGFDGENPDLGFARKGFLAYDSANPKLKGSYKLPFAIIVDGRLTAMPSGIQAAASRLPQTDIPDDVQKKARAVLDDYEAKMKDGKSGATKIVKTAKPKLKGLYDVAQLAYLLGELGWIHDCSAWEEEAEQDGSKVPAMLADALRQLADALIAMTTEEVNEMLSGHGIDVIDVLPIDEDYVLAAPTPYAKNLRAAFRKAGRILSQANQDHLDKLTKCLGDLADSHVRAADLHDDLRDALGEMHQHIEHAGEHAKAMCENASGKKPDDDSNDDDPDNPDEPGSDDDNADIELAGDPERRKRLVEVMALADAP